MKTTFLSFFIFALTLASDAALNLFTNPGFENGDLSGWSVGGKNGGFGVGTDGSPLPVTSAVPELPGFYYASWQNERSGNFAAYGITAGDSQGSFSEYVSFSQNLALTQGTYQFGFWLSTDNENGGVGLSSAMGDGRLGIYVDGSYIPFTTAPSPISTLTLNWLEFKTQTSLATGNHSIELRISAGGTKRVGISLDDTFAVALPEPSCVALITLGLALFGFIRRDTFPAAPSRRVETL